MYLVLVRIGVDNIETRITEKFEYKTDIITAYDGTEQRIRLRKIPRHYVTYDYDAMDKYEAQCMRSVLRYKQTGVVFIPMWHNASKLNRNSLDSSKSIYVDKKYIFNFHNCDALMFWKGDNIDVSNDAHYILSVNSEGLIALKTGVKGDKLVEYETVIPLIRCIIQPVDMLKYYYSNGSNSNINYEDILFEPPIDYPSEYILDLIENDIEGNLYNLPRNYKGYEVLTEAPQWAGDDMSIAIIKNTNKLDNTTGIFKYDNKSNMVVDKSSMNFLLYSKEAINNFIRFFKRQQGAFKAFFVPSWVNDIEPYEDLIEGRNYFFTKYDLYSKYYNKGSKKSEIVIFLKNNETVLLSITAYTTDTINNEKVGKILLSKSLTKTIKIKDIRMISFINLCRFDDDTLKVDYHTCDVAEIQTVFKEVGA